MTDHPSPVTPSSQPDHRRIAKYRFDGSGGQRQQSSPVNSEASWREKLLRRLEGIGHPLPETFFILLWTYFQETGVRRVENSYTARGEHMVRLPPFPLPAGDASAAALQRGVEELRKDQGLELDLAAARWLVTLDRHLRERKLSDVPILGLDGQRRFRIFRRNLFVANPTSTVCRR